MDEKEAALLKAKRFLRASEASKKTAEEYEKRALEIFYTLGYCNCSCAHYRIDKDGNCVVCGRPSRTHLK